MGNVDDAVAAPAAAPAAAEPSLLDLSALARR